MQQIINLKKFLKNFYKFIKGLIYNNIVIDKLWISKKNLKIKNQK